MKLNRFMQLSLMAIVAISISSTPTYSMKLPKTDIKFPITQKQLIGKINAFRSNKNKVTAENLFKAYNDFVSRNRFTDRNTETANKRLKEGGTSIQEVKQFAKQKIAAPAAAAPSVARPAPTRAHKHRPRKPAPRPTRTIEEPRKETPRPTTPATEEPQEAAPAVEPIEVAAPEVIPTETTPAAEELQEAEPAAEPTEVAAPEVAPAEESQEEVPAVEPTKEVAPEAKLTPFKIDESGKLRVNINGEFNELYTVTGQGLQVLTDEALEALKTYNPIEITTSINNAIDNADNAATKRMYVQLSILFNKIPEDSTELRDALLQSAKTVYSKLSTQDRDSAGIKAASKRLDLEEPFTSTEDQQTQTTTETSAFQRAGVALASMLSTGREALRGAFGYGRSTEETATPGAEEKEASPVTAASEEEQEASPSPAPAETTAALETQPATEEISVQANEDENTIKLVVNDTEYTIGQNPAFENALAAWDDATIDSISTELTHINKPASNTVAGLFNVAQKNPETASKAKQLATVLIEKLEPMEKDAFQTAFANLG